MIVDVKNRVPIFSIENSNNIKLALPNSSLDSEVIILCSDNVRIIEIGSDELKEH